MAIGNGLLIDTNTSTLAMSIRFLHGSCHDCSEIDADVLPSLARFMYCGQ